MDTLTRDKINMEIKLDDGQDRRVNFMFCHTMIIEAEEAYRNIILVGTILTRIDVIKPTARNFM